MSGIGMYAVASFNEDGFRCALGVAQSGAMTPTEKAARDVFVDEPDGTAEMCATKVERLAALIPVHCADGGVVVDAPALVRSLRQGAVLN